MMRNIFLALLMMTTLSLSMNGQEADDYKPFVNPRSESGNLASKRKVWYVVHTQPGNNPDYAMWLSDCWSVVEYNLKTDEVIKDDKIYYTMKVSSQCPWPKRDGTLLREEDHKVYVYSKEDEREYLLYDFSLKAGDSFTSYDIDSEDILNLKVLEEGTLTDGPWIYPYNIMLKDENLERQKRPLRTWLVGRETETGDFEELFTMIEGIGCNEGPFFTVDKTKGCSYPIFIEGPSRSVNTDTRTITKRDDMSFELSNTQYATVRVCDFPLGDEKEAEEPENMKHDLSFEMEDGQLHVSGYSYVQCCLNYYSLFIEEPTDDPMVHILRFYILPKGPGGCFCYGFFQTDLYVSGFGPGDNENAPEGYDPSKIDYIVVDEWENEYPVINKKHDAELNPDDYKPFVETIDIGTFYPDYWVKEWKVVHTEYAKEPSPAFVDYAFWLSDNYSFDRYDLMNEKMLANGNLYYKMNVYSRSHSQRTVWLREDNRKVYVYSEADEKEYLLYDFSLKEGDTCAFYDIDSGEMVQLKALKEDLLTDGPLIYPYNKTLTYQNLEEQKRPLRTWVMGIESDATVFPPEYQELFTMIEGVGCNEGPFFSYNKTAGCGCDYLAFIVEPSRMIKTDSEDFYCIHEISFPIANTKYAAVRGCDLPIGEKVSDYGEPNELTFVLEDGLLHVYGNVCVGCASTDYVYFVELPTENPNCHKLKMSIDVTAWEVATCQGMYQTDFWVPGFGFGDMENGTAAFNTDTIEYKVVITEPYRTYEYPVIKKRQQTLTSRPFVEENKVWKVGAIPADTSNNRIDMVQYFYFDGDTIVDGKVCKRMMERDYTKENSSDYDDSDASLSYVGAWYEKPYKVYFAAPEQKLRLMYDFSVNEGEIVRMDNGFEFTFTKIFGDINGFKGACYNLNVPVINTNVPDGLLTNVWLEGVGSANRPDINLDCDLMHLYTVLMSCTVGDEVIYLNDSYEDGVSPDANVPKRRIDFTHTVKVKPKAPVRKNTDETEEDPLVGEYSDRLLNIDLGKLNNDYSMVIKNQNDSVVYVKSVRANEIVALSIDISDYDGGDYTINIENADEVFSGVFSINPTAIHEVASDSNEYGLRTKDVIYDLTGRPVTKDRLSKGIYIQNGKKVLVK